MSPSTLLPRIIPATAKKRESALWSEFRNQAKKLRPKWILTRIETRLTPGIPDVLLCDEQGTFHFIELKYTTSNVVALSPHQVSWLTKHSHSHSWILVRRGDRRGKGDRETFLYPASEAMDLRMEGLVRDPLFHCNKEVPWATIFDVISDSVFNAIV